MKANQTNRDGKNSNVATSIKNACVASCQKILARVAKAKEAIFAEARETLGAHTQLVKLAVNEAEALAWQTNYPHLVFPTLAAEKVQAVARWSERQQSVRGANAEFALAA
jgi:hypothetical protein